MKSLSILSFLMLTFSMARSQGVGIGTSAPAASSMLDVSSTTKGMLIPRMTTLQRAAILSPGTGLLVFDTDSKTIWAYDGAAWKNLYTSGGLVLPFASTVNLGISAFNIGNQGLGAAIEGSSVADFGIGMTAKSTGAGGWGLYAYSNGSGAKSINAFADNGTAIHGENNNPANTNTLLSLQNRGIGKTATFQLTNNTSNSGNVQIAGNNLGEQLTIFQTNAANIQPAVSITNSGSGAGVISTSTNGIAFSGVSSTNNAVRGITNSSTGSAAIHGQNTGSNGVGVYGLSNALGTNGVSGLSASGTGVRAESNTGAGLVAYSGSGFGITTGTLSGTGLYTSSISGLALQVNGNIRVAGGNTNPVAGAVLTSDASGNATWQMPAAATPKVGFRCYGTSSAETNGTPNNSFSHAEPKKVEFNTESYDSHGDFTPTGGGTSNSNTSSFLAPFNGVYHFDATVKVADNTVFSYLFVELEMKLKRAGVTSSMARKVVIVNETFSTSISISSDYYLQAGDRVWVEFMHNNWSFSSSALETSGILSFFSGHLIYQP